MKFLKDIDSPKDLRKLDAANLPEVAAELRQHITDVITKEGGHFGGSMGVADLTIGLHYAFETPKDQLIWDIGHQAYAHKVLTGRRDNLHTIRKTGGLAPFLKIQESEFDHFGAGHTATSISAAYGIAVARDLKNEDFHVVALIGDGAITGGLPFEAMNNIGKENRNIIIVLNDNQMSIDPNCGSLCKHFNDLVQENTEQNIFKAMGLQYYGPFDGHNFDEILPALEEAKARKGPQVLHFRTEKGSGYEPAKDHPLKSHAISVGSKKPQEKYNVAFGKELVRLASEDDKLVGITPTMCTGSSMNEFAEKFPERFFDVAIAEQHAVTFAAGLAKEGMKPFATIYSTFLQRAYDQVIHDVCVQNLPVRFFLDRAGLVGADGPTHHGVFDLAYMRSLPNMVVQVPRDEFMLKQMMSLALNYQDGPIATRYPRGYGEGERAIKSDLQFGKAEVLKEGSDVVIFGVGPWLYDALEVANESEKSVAVVDAVFVKPLDKDMLNKFSGVKKWVTIEDGSVVGGFGSALAEWISSNNHDIHLERLGVPDEFVEHGSISDLRRIIGCDKEAIKKAIQD